MSMVGLGSVLKWQNLGQIPTVYDKVGLKWKGAYSSMQWCHTSMENERLQSSNLMKKNYRGFPIHQQKFSVGVLKRPYLAQISTDFNQGFGARAEVLSGLPVLFI